MSIIYSVISKVNSSDDVINLCSYDMAFGNYPTVTQQILKNAKIPESITYKYDEQYNFHILKDQILLFVCLTTSSFKVKRAFTFLQDIKKRFKQKYSVQQIMGAKDYDMSASFSDIYKSQINYFNNSQGQDKSEIVLKSLDSVQQKLAQSIEKVLQRQQKIELIVKKSAKVGSIADEIKRSAIKMKKQAFWKKNKCKLAIAGIIVLACLSLFIVL